MNEDENKIEKLQEELAEESKRIYDNKKLIEDIIRLFNDSGFSNEIKSAVLLDSCWALTERKTLEDSKGVIRRAPKAKISGCDYWSKSAFEAAYLWKDENGKKGYYNIDNKGYLKKKPGLRSKYRDLSGDYFDEGTMVVHEHLIPRKVLTQALLTPTITGYTSIKDVTSNLTTFLKCFKACVITKDENKKIANELDRKMPNESNFKDIVGMIDAARLRNEEEKVISDIMWSRYSHSENLLSEDNILKRKCFIVYKIKWEPHFTAKRLTWKTKGISEILCITESKRGNISAWEKLKEKDLDDFIRENRLEKIRSVTMSDFIEKDLNNVFMRRIKDVIAKTLSDENLSKMERYDRRDREFRGNVLFVSKNTELVNENVERYLKEADANIITVTPNGYQIQKKWASVDISPGSEDFILPGDKMTDELKKENTVLFLPNLDRMNDLIYRRFLLDMIRTHIVSDSRNGKHGYTKLHYSFIAIATVGEMKNNDFFTLISTDAENSFQVYNLDE